MQAVAQSSKVTGSDRGTFDDPVRGGDMNGADRKDIIEAGARLENSCAPACRSI